MSCPNLFVYGTLLSIFQNPYAQRLRRQATLLGPARMRGRLYNLGAYPGMKCSLDPADWVTGEVYRLHHPVKILAFLDAYEVCDPRDGSSRQFERVQATAHLNAGRRITAWVYFYGRPVNRSSRIPNGDYGAFARDRKRATAATVRAGEPLK